MTKIVETKIDELIPDGKNANKGTEYGQSLVEKSLRKFGAGRSILIDKNNKIIAGNKTVENAANIGLDDVIIVEADGSKIIAVKRNDIDLDSEEGRELAIADNATAKANIDWDVDVMNEISKEWDINPVDWGISIPEFVNIELGEDEDINIENIDTVKTDIKLGDIFEIGEHKLICGDAILIDDVKKLFIDEKAELIITDPPYNVDYEGKTKKRLKIQNDLMSKDDYYTFMLNAVKNMTEYLKDGGCYYIWHSESEGINIRLALISAGLEIKQCLIWNKNSIVLGRQDYQWKHEPCLYGWKKGASHKWYGDRKQTTILEFPKPMKSELHPTMKPVPLISYLIKNSSKNGDIVFDPFLGSGTTMVSAEQLKRKCYGMEIDPKYCQVIIDRMLSLFPEIKINKNGMPYNN